MALHRLRAFFLLAYALTWWVYPLLWFDPLIGLVGLVGPALAVLIVTALFDSRPGVQALVSRGMR